MSRDRGTSASPQHDEDGDRSNRSTEKGNWRRLDSSLGIPYPEQIRPFDELKSVDARVVFPHPVRKRITEATRQIRDIIVERVATADRPHATATEAGLILEIKEIAKAKAEGLPEDVRAAYMSAAASMVLLAELADRPEIKSRYREVRDERKAERQRNRGWE